MCWLTISRGALWRDTVVDILLFLFQMVPMDPLFRSKIQCSESILFMIFLKIFKMSAEDLILNDEL